MDKFIPFDGAFDDKATLIDYFNDEQACELANFATALLAVPKGTLQQISLSDIGKTGLLLSISDHQSTTTHFLPFQKAIHRRDDLQAQYILLLQKCAKQLGKNTIEIKQRQFTVLDNYPITANMQRLVLKSMNDLSHLPAGYAFLFQTKLQAQSAQNQATNRALRYYTLRNAYQKSHAQAQHIAWIDIYCHGKKQGAVSLGEQWVKSRQAGDVILSEREFFEKIDHLACDNAHKNAHQTPQQSLLIADETALPTVARLLETWGDCLSPIVIAFLQSRHELAYLDGVVKPCLTKILPVIADNNQSPHEQIFAVINDFLKQSFVQIDSVWGGLEAMTTKKLRPLLCDLFNLSREKMVLKVYWCDG